MKNSIYILRQISETLSNHQTFYTFNKMDDHLSEKYRKKGLIDKANKLLEKTTKFSTNP